MSEPEKPGDEQEPPQIAIASPLISRYLLLCFSLIVFSSSIFIWLYTADIFEVPSDVLEGRKKFLKAQREFCEKSSFWQARWVELERSLHQSIEESREHDIPALLQQFSPQVIVAYAVNELCLSKDRLRSLAIVPKLSGSSLIVVVSKPEPDMWPLPVVLSIEIEVTVSSKGVQFVILRLRRGTRELTPSLSWAYFGADIDIIKRSPYVTVRTA